MDTPPLTRDGISNIAIVFDEAQDAPGILDSIDGNGALVGKGPTGK